MLHADNHVFGGQLCVLFFLFRESGLWHHARLSPPSYRQRGSVCMYACFCICCGGAERVRTQGRMLHVDSCILVGSSGYYYFTKFIQMFQKSAVVSTRDFGTMTELVPPT